MNIPKALVYTFIIGSLLITPQLLSAKTGSSEQAEPQTLTAYLAYAALHNPGLESAFNLWKGALEVYVDITPRRSHRLRWRQHPNW